MHLSSLSVCALLLLTGLVGCKPPPGPAPAPPPAPVNVRLAAVEMSTASPLIRSPGVLARQTEAELSFPVGGMIDRIPVRPGDRVTKGQELARLQPDHTEAQFVQATTLLEKAKRDLGRIEKLQAERVATLESLQDARSNVEQAAATLRIAEFNRRHSVIVAPTGGFVLRRFAEPNELAAAGRAVLAFASEGEGWIAKTSLAARDAARIELGANVAVDDGDHGPAAGTVVRIAEAADPATRTVPIEITIPSPPAGARSGLVVTLSITPRPLPARASVPLAALRDGAGGRAVLFLVESGAKSARRFNVEVAQIDGDRAYLKTALPSGTRVIVAGVQYVQDGTIVNVTD